MRSALFRSEPQAKFAWGALVAVILVISSVVFRAVPGAVWQTFLAAIAGSLGLAALGGWLVARTPNPRFADLAFLGSMGCLVAGFNAWMHRIAWDDYLWIPIVCLAGLAASFMLFGLAAIVCMLAGGPARSNHASDIRAE